MVVLALAILVLPLLGGAAGFLLFRLIAAQWVMRRSIRTALWDDLLAKHLVRLIDLGVDQSFLLPAKGGGFADIEVRLREHFDTYHNVVQLLEFQAGAVRKNTFDDWVNAIKALYQLQHALGLAPADAEECLQELVSRLKSATFAGKHISRVDTVSPGALLDQRTMMPLDFGSQVKQPLGVIVLAQDGKVLSKAKVFCS